MQDYFPFVAFVKKPLPPTASVARRTRRHLIVSFIADPCPRDTASGRGASDSIVELKDDKLNALKNKCLPPGFAERFDLFEHAMFPTSIRVSKKVGRYALTRIALRKYRTDLHLRNFYL
jgi:hypothetical protein